MSGETEGNVSGWTVDTLRAHVASLSAETDQRYEQRFVAQEKAVAAALAAAKEAVAMAEANAEKWRENANEWRGAMSDRERNFVTRREIVSALLAAIAVATFVMQLRGG